jgi:hypothetical protein
VKQNARQNIPARLLFASTNFCSKNKTTKPEYKEGARFMTKIIGRLRKIAKTSLLTAAQAGTERKAAMANDVRNDWKYGY